MKNLRNRNQPPNADLVQVYLQSSWDKVLAVYSSLDNINEVADAIAGGTLDDFLSTTDIDTIAKLNAILTDANLGDFATQAEAEAGMANDKTMTPLRVAQAIAVLAAGIQNNFVANADPTANDDSGDGYSAGSVWINIALSPPETYRCADPSLGAAVWVKTSLTSDELAVVALSGNSDDLLQGVTKLLMTVAERNKLAGIEANATADQTAAEIEAGYNAQVAVVSQLEAEAGALTDVRRWTPQRVAQAIAALSASGLSWSSANSSVPLVKDTGTVFYALGATVTGTLPAAPAVGDSLMVVNNDSNPSDLYNVNVTAGASNEIRQQNVTMIPQATVVQGETALFVCYDAGATKRWHMTKWVSSLDIANISGYIPVFVAGGGSHNAVQNNLVCCRTDGGVATVVLPNSTPDKTHIAVLDVGFNASVNNITVDRNGKTINGAASNFIVDVSGGRVDFVFDTATDTWEYRPDFSVDDDLTDPDIVAAVSASAKYQLAAFNNRLYVPISGWYDGTTPADFGAFTRVESAAGAAMYGYRTASGTVDQEAQAAINISERYNVDDHGFKFQVEWIPTTTGAGNVKFELSAVGYADGDESTKAFVVGSTVVDACLASTTKVHISPLSAAFTFTAAQLPPGLTHWRLRRLATDAADTYGSDIRILSVIIHASPMAFNDLNGNDF